jgi:hypothetical protein
MITKLSIDNYRECLPILEEKSDFGLPSRRPCAALTGGDHKDFLFYTWPEMDMFYDVIFPFETFFT